MNEISAAGPRSWRDFELEQCPIRMILDRVAAKWTVLILLELREGPHRFNELQRKLPDISRRMLTQGLRDLERDGIVSRTVFDTRPPSVRYALTETGWSLMAPLLSLVEWAVENQGAISGAQRDFDERSSG